ncbi:MAG TPA: CusA/CzcA family heavy metal efflux RND transporter [Candidatus Krumholzibacteria bacterium]|nr:CusA/CzcA family heavy metal efflux RND transporter [Candidatus Krumholzibacteria bacterium]HPD72938.1 CusA/CzcA family heavy metal efflux RND transporter [Candidatus Krumholzibacteria bacterium]HRY41737.1 CusA/CzcA family heavy metal efflux RND transporter [Candidatus Krumholzibacteria bacterium]
MIPRIIEFSARNRLLVLTLTALACAYAVHTLQTIRLDALPDLSDTQVIVYGRWDRSPDIVEDQVTYPIVSGLLGAPRVKAIRGFSDFGYAFIYVVFEDGTDLYWARSRVLEYLDQIQPRLPAGVNVALGPDATGVGWVFQYALVDPANRHPIDELRAYQDWTLRYALQAVPGVAEVASIGGYQRQYQITVDPVRLDALDVPLHAVMAAVQASNDEVGGRLLEWSGAEYMVRGRGYARTLADFEQIVVKTTPDGVPVLLRDVAQVALGPELRRGVADLDGLGDAVGGIVVMRHGENALNVINRVKAKLHELEPGLPAGVKVVTTYDRGDLIERAIDTLEHELILQMIIVSLVILVFLWHVPSALVPILTIPISVLLAFIPLRALGVTVNIMSLSGIAISIGVLVDGAIVEVENAYNKIHLWQVGGRRGSFHDARLSALKEVGPSVFFSLLVIAVAFIPVFALVDQEGRLFKPLAYSKNLAMALAAILAITLDPAVRMMFARSDPFAFRPRWLARFASATLVGTYHAEERHPISRVIFRVYDPACRFVLRHPRKVIAAAVLVVLVTLPAFFGLGTEFMPPLNEGSILYMPTTLPGISITQATELLQTQDRVLKSFPEVERVYGKAGRADTSTDPAPLSMMETTVILKPQDQWRAKDRWYSGWLPGFLQPLVRPLWPDRLSWDELVAEMDRALRIPGVTNAWTMPIKARIDMLTTGVRTPVGVKIFGPDLAELERLGTEMESLLVGVEGTRSVFAERAAGGYFVDIVPRRDELARHGLVIADLQEVVMTAIGGENLGAVIDGRARYPVNVRYPRELRDDLEQLGRVLVDTPSGAAVPLAQVADLAIVSGPAMLRDENGFLASYVFVDVAGRDIGGYVAEAKRLVREQVALPAGYTVQWSGQYENMLRVQERLRLVVPATLVLIFLLLLANTRSSFKALVILLSVPFSAVGAIWLLHLLDYNVSIAVWVGVIALLGLDAETAVFMLLFLDLAYDSARREGRLRNVAELDAAILHGAVKRARPKLMTVTATFMGLLPIMWSTSAGADVMKRIAAPMIGGLATSFLLELLVYPAIYKLWKLRELRREWREPDAAV